MVDLLWLKNKFLKGWGFCFEFYIKFETEIRIMNEINLNDIEDGLFTAIMREMKTCVQ